MFMTGVGNRDRRLCVGCNEEFSNFEHVCKWNYFSAAYVSNYNVKQIMRIINLAGIKRLVRRPERSFQPAHSIPQVGSRQC
jgi:hypothetical protein